jgi:hypothetical protein
MFMENVDEQVEVKIERVPIGVYVKKDNHGKVVEINSDVFIEDLTGWEKIDEGFGDKFAHAQSQYKL